MKEEIANFGLFQVLASYITLYHHKYFKLYWDTYNEIFPNFWPLRHSGDADFIRFRRLAKRTILTSLIMAIAITLEVTAALPWYGNEYDVHLPVKIAVDYLTNWKLDFHLVLFFLFSTTMD